MAYYPKKKVQESPYNHTVIRKQRVDQGISYSQLFVGGHTNTVKDLDAVRQSIFQILATPLGSRFFLPNYGCRLFELIFEPNDEVVESLGEIYIRDALKQWEPRITVDQVKVIANDYTLEVRVHYTNNQTLAQDLFNTYIQRG